MLPFPPIANPAIPRLTDLALTAVVESFNSYPNFDRIPKKFRNKVLQTLDIDTPLTTAVISIPDGLFWKRLVLTRFSDLAYDPKRKTWKSFYIEHYAAKRIEEASVEELDQLFEELTVLGPFIRELVIKRLPSKISMLRLFRTFRGLKSLSLVYGEPRRSFEYYSEFETYDLTADHDVTLADCQNFASDFEQLGTNCRLQRFSMSDNSLKDRSFIRIAKGLVRLNTLTHLCFSHNEIGNSGAFAIASCMATSPIESLDLTDNKIGHDAAENICNLAMHCPTLKTLLLGSNNIGTKGVLFFGQLIKKSTSIEKIDLSGNRITSFRDLISFVPEAKSLKELIVYANPLDENERKELREATDANKIISEVDMRTYELKDEDFTIKTTETSEAPLLRFK